MEALLMELMTALGELRLGLIEDCERTLNDAVAIYLGAHDDLSEDLRLELLATITDQKESAWQS